MPEENLLVPGSLWLSWNDTLVKVNRTFTFPVSGRERVVYEYSDPLGGSKHEYVIPKKTFVELYRYVTVDAPGGPKPVAEDVTSRMKVLLEVNDERKYQRSLWSKSFDSNNSPNDWAAYIITYLGEAVKPFDGAGDTDGPAIFRKKMIKVAALAVAAIEACDARED